jgi:hypothetical protein
MENSKGYTTLDLACSAIELDGSRPEPMLYYVLDKCLQAFLHRNRSGRLHFHYLELRSHEGIPHTIL